METVFRNSICMLGIQRDDGFKQIGTGVMFYHNNEYLIVTANHVALKLIDYKIVIYYGEIKIEISHNSSQLFYIKQEKLPSQAGDILDIAVLKISESEIIKEYNKERNIPEFFVKQSQIKHIEYNSNSPNYIFQALGFPSYLNDIHLFDHALKFPMRRNGITIAGRNRSEEVILDTTYYYHPDGHVAVDIENLKLSNGELIEMDQFSPDGMSGGLIEKIYEDNGIVYSVPEAIILGANLKYKFIIGIKLELVFKLLNKWFPA